MFIGWHSTRFLHAMVIGKKKHGHQGAGLFRDLINALWHWSDTGPLGPLVLAHLSSRWVIVIAFCPSCVCQHLLSSQRVNLDEISQKASSQSSHQNSFNLLGSMQNSGFHGNVTKKTFKFFYQTGGHECLLVQNMAILPYMAIVKT